MQAFVCMMQRDWPQVHQEGKRREELFKQSVNRPIAIGYNLILPNLNKMPKLQPVRKVF